jgi:hypothetical protein
MLNINTFTSYFVQRLKVFPWLVLPIYLIIYSNTFLPKTTLVIYSFLTIISFRLFDDYSCTSFDQAQGKNRSYQKDLPQLRKWMISLLMSLLIFSFLSIGHTIALATLFTIVLSALLYAILKNNTAIQFISLLKYPLITSAIEYSLTKQVSMWPIYLFATFFFTELLEVFSKDIYKKRAQYIQYISLILLILVKNLRG